MRLGQNLLLLLGFIPSQAGTVSNTQPLTRLSDDVASLMKARHISGGIVEYHACATEQKHFALQGGDFESALDSLASSAELHWTISASNTYFVEIGPPSHEKLIATVLPPLVVSGVDLIQEANFLFANSVISSRTLQLGIRFYDRSFGFTSSNKTVKMPDLILPMGTLGEDLNRIAAQKPGAVWIYVQNTCGSGVTSTFSWVSQ